MKKQGEKSNFILNGSFMRTPIPSTVDKQSCIEAFEDLISKSSDDDVKKSYTKSVTYDKAELLDWLTDNCDEANNIKIYFGRYTQDFKDDIATVFENNTLTNKVKVDRITAILVACNDNEEIGAFDLGSIEP